MKTARTHTETSNTKKCDRAREGEGAHRHAQFCPQLIFTQLIF